MAEFYVGRFAPSPTGPLHFGSLVAALGSYLDARAHGGQWLVRMEDLDPPRAIPGAASEILHQLEAHGLLWDGPVMFQSQRQEAYKEALARFVALGLVYPCECSRQQVQAMGGIYSGRCRHACGVSPDGNALRIEVAGSVAFDDLFQGSMSQALPVAVGDFIVRRRDGLFAYQLAVVVDDAEQGINHVIRGCDLLDSTPRQIYLMQCLGSPIPVYGHLPVALNDQDQKLSKQNLAPSLSRFSTTENLCTALQWLGFSSVTELAEASVDEILLWAVSHWRRDSVPAVASKPAPAAY